MVLIKHTLLPILGITSFIIFYFGILNFITTENHSIDLEDLAMENIQLENVYNMMMIDTVRSQTIKHYLDTGERVWKHNYIENKQSLGNIIDASNYYSTSKVSTEIAEKQKITFEGLKKLEEEIINKIDNGQTEEALKIFNSNVYLQQKDLFTNTLRESLDHHKAVAMSLEHNTKQRAEDAHYTAVTMLLFAGVVSAGVMVSTVYISGLITKPIEKLELCMKDFSIRNKMIPIGYIIVAFFIIPITIILIFS